MGKEFRYCFSDKELENAKNELVAIKTSRQKNIKVKSAPKKTDVDNVDEESEETQEVKLDVQRYKGLGEMNPQQLWETTMDPKFRVLKQVSIENAESANEIFEILMGSEVEPRKNFIQTHAKTVKNLDI